MYECIPLHKHIINTAKVYAMIMATFVSLQFTITVIKIAI